MLVAVRDQSLGTSTSFCSKMIPPFESVICARRFSHSTSSYGELPALVKKRRMVRPVAFCFGAAGAAVAAVVVVVWVWISAILVLSLCFPDLSYEDLGLRKSQAKTNLKEKLTRRRRNRRFFTDHRWFDLTGAALGHLGPEASSPFCFTACQTSFPNTQYAIEPADREPQKT